MNQHMARLGSRKPASAIALPAKKQIVLSISAALLFPVHAMADDTPAAAPKETALPTVNVQSTAIDPNPNAELGAPYKAKTSGDTRHTKPLAEIPQTIEVVTRSAIDDSGFTDLKQILGSQPGITLGVGENGNMFGDNYIIRGQSAKSDIFVDGLRDPGMNTRESFAIEQVEITKGPNSSFAGRGSAGGAVNAITKQATLDYDFAKTAIGLGTDSYQRYTADINKAIGNSFAVRLNALWGDEDVPKRDGPTRGRKGLAASGLWEATPDFSVTLDYYGLRAADKLYDAGSFLVGTSPFRRPAVNVPVSSQNGEGLWSDTDTGTARIKWNLAPNLTLNSLTRYGKTENSYYFSTDTYNAVANAATINDQHQRWQDVTYFAHQDNLRWDKNLFGMKHEIVGTFEYSDHHVEQGIFSFVNTAPFNCRTTAGPGANNAYCVTIPGSGTDGPSVANPSSVTGRAWTRGRENYDWHVKTVAVSLMDSVDFTDRITGFGGFRLDRIFNFTAQTFNTNTGASTGLYQYEETLHNGWAGLSYKLTPQGMVYVGYGTGQDINGGEPDSGTAAGYGGLVTVTGSGVNVNAKPETSQNWELGTKWNLMNEKLLATAAIFRTDKSDVMETLSTAEFAVSGTSNTGGNRVEGVEFGLVGNITDKLSIQAGAAFMKSKITKSDPTIAGGGAAAIGHPLSNFADNTYSIMPKYQLTKDFSFGGTLRHESERCGGQPDTAAVFDANTDCTQKVPSYTVFDLFADYRFTKKLDLRMNVINAGDKLYYTGVYRSGNWLTIGDRRRIQFTLNYDFE